jgi:hypothetical protein
MAVAGQLSRPVVKALADAKIIGLRAGLDQHRFLGVWVVVVDGRAFVRPYFNKRGGWYQVFLEEPRGLLQVGDREMPIRVKQSRGERLLDAIDEAYGAKYPTPGSRRWVRGFATAGRRSRTLELMPR